MRLKALQGLEREKLEAEYKELEEKIAYYQRLLSDEALLRSVLKEELGAIRERYGDDRATEIQEVEDEIDIEDLIEEEECCYTLSDTGYIKRMPVDAYRSQKRGGRGVNAQNLKEEDFVRTMCSASSHDYLLFFTNIGKVHRIKGYRIPEAGRTARGTAIVNVLPLEPDEQVTAMLPTRQMQTEDYLVMVTRNGTVKRLRLEQLNTARRAGIRALTLDEGDALIAVLKTDGTNDIFLATSEGMAICFNEGDIRPMGRGASGVRGIKLNGSDFVVGAEIAAWGKQLLSVTENGYGKRTEMVEYMRLGEDGARGPQNRGGKGMRNYGINEKTGRVTGICIVDDSDDIMLIETGGVIIRMAASAVNIYKRGTRGVILMRVEDGNRVIGIVRVDQVQEEPGDGTEPAEDEPAQTD
jgi:DNA gyrase subunit A